MKHATALACTIALKFPIVFSVTVVIPRWLGVILALSPTPTSDPANGVIQTSTRRNRSGRRVAGRRRARPGRGRAGRKYLKRTPWRSGKVYRKRRRGRGRGRGREYEPFGGVGLVGLPFVRGGGHPTDENVCKNVFGFVFYRLHRYQISVHQTTHSSPTRPTFTTFFVVSFCQDSATSIDTRKSPRDHHPTNREGTGSSRQRVEKTPEYWKENVDHCVTNPYHTTPSS